MSGKTTVFAEKSTTFGDSHFSAHNTKYTRTTPWRELACAITSTRSDTEAGAGVGFFGSPWGAGACQAWRVPALF